MSKRNLVTVTCSLSQSDLLKFVEKYGISMCYDPQLHSSDKTALDALEGYISLYLSLFTIAPLGLSMLLLSLLLAKPIGENYGASLQIFSYPWPCWRLAYVSKEARSQHSFHLWALLPTLILQNHLMRLYGILFVVILLKLILFQSLSCILWVIPILRKMAFRNFMKKPGQTASFSMRPTDQPIDVDSLSIDRLKAAVDNDQVKSSFVSKNKDISGLKLAVIGEGFSRQNADVDEGSKKRCLITEALEEEATIVRLVTGDNSLRPMFKKRKPKGPRRTSTRGSVPLLPTTAPKGAGKHLRVLAHYIRNLASSSDSIAPDVKDAYSTHNTLSNLHYPLLKDKLGFLTFDELVNVYDVHALQMAVVRNMIINKSRIISRDHTKLKDDSVSLKSKNGLLEHKISKLENILSKARKNQDMEGSQTVMEQRARGVKTSCQGGRALRAATSGFGVVERFLVEGAREGCRSIFKA
nr:hypothetical protein [Tanacetum cinerariifolium]